MENLGAWSKGDISNDFNFVFKAFLFWPQVQRSCKKVWIVRQFFMFRQTAKKNYLRTNKPWPSHLSSALKMLIWRWKRSLYYYFYFCETYHFFAPCKGIQVSLGFWIPRHRFQIPGPRFRILCQWNLDSGFQSLVGFRIHWAVFRILKPRFAHSTRKISRIPDSGFPYRGWILRALNVHSRDCTVKQQIYVSPTHKSA